MSPYFKKIILLASALVLSAAAAFAAEGDVALSVCYNDGEEILEIGSGIMRGSDLWITEDTAKAAGIPLTLAPKGKSFLLKVQNPAEVFEIKSLERLAGSHLTLQFLALIEDDVKYFNVLGMERITRLAPELNGDSLMLRKMDPSAPLPEKAPAPELSEGKIKAVWAHITKTNPDLSKETAISAVDVVMPTWFNLVDGKGGMANRASAAYVEDSHRRGHQVWGLVSNGFSKTLSTALFKDAHAVNLFIARILAYAKLYNLDGINIDFEGLDRNDRDAFVRFMSILSPHMKEQGLTFSVDVFIPANSNSSKSHDRKSLSKHVDYVMLMAYDQHWRTSPVAGSVASIKWVEAAVSNTLAEGVPSEKLVLGVPFYMRLWEETKLKNGKVKVKARTLTMDEAYALAAKQKAQMKWLDSAGQNYFDYKAGGKTCKVWVEDSKSIELKLGLIEKYDLAGVAAWRKGHENIAVWGTIDRLVK
jgi:spore germination protein YaaH